MTKSRSKHRLIVSSDVWTSHDSSILPPNGCMTLRAAPNTIGACSDIVWRVRLNLMMFL